MREPIGNIYGETKVCKIGAALFYITSIIVIRQTPREYEVGLNVRKFSFGVVLTFSLFVKRRFVCSTVLVNCITLVALSSISVFLNSRFTDLKFKKFPPRNPGKIEPYP